MGGDHDSHGEPVKASSSAAPRPIRNLYVSSLAYNIITLTDGALRAIVLLFLVQLGFSAIALSIMFAIYELMGVVMNLVGGVLGARYGMRFLVLLSTLGQVACVVILAPMEVTFPNLSDAATRNTIAITIYVVVAQMFSGVSKDLMKIQGKSVPKLVTKAEGDDDKLFKIVAILTGMKNSVKGFGYLFGSLLLWGIGWVGSLCVQGALLCIIIPCALRWMDDDLGISKKAEQKAKFTTAVFRKGYNVNVLSGARFFLFGSRDIWFEVAAPYFFRSVLMWAPFAVGGFMAGYTIIYGQLQALTSQMFSPKQCLKRNPNKKDVPLWAGLAAVEVLVLGLGAFFAYQASPTGPAITAVLIAGIVLFAALFAVNSAVHSFLIVQYSNRDKVAMDVGFYYMSNAGGRLVGTLSSGFIYTYTVDQFGLAVCLWVAAVFLFISALVAAYLREHVVVRAPTHPEAEVEAQDAQGSVVLPHRVMDTSTSALLGSANGKASVLEEKTEEKEEEIANV